jgi:predicted metal-binding membrane protein
MDRLQKILIISLISTSAASWLVSQAFSAEMMSAMATPFGALPVSLFVAVWTAGMAAMMFPAISPVVLLYNRLIKNNDTALVVEARGAPYPLKMVLFVGCYLAVWALAGLVLLLAWSLPLSFIQVPPVVYGIILAAAGAYQFSSIKSKCLGYCESPMSLFMKRWKKGAAGAVSMGTYHGLYCLGCCWPYFLIMVALGWMDILWMALFAGVIFGEKMWSKGIWVARAAGIALIVVGIAAALGAIDVASPQMMNMEMDMPPVGAGSADQGGMPGMAPPESSNGPDEGMGDMNMG